MFRLFEFDKLSKRGKLQLSPAEKIEKMRVQMACGKLRNSAKVDTCLQVASPVKISVPPEGIATSSGPTG